MLRRTRLWSWLTRATGTVAAWGLAVSWAQAQPPGPPPTGAEGKAPRPTTTAPPPPPPTRAPGAESTTSQPEPEPDDVDLSNAWGYSRTRSPRPRYVRNTQDPIVFSPNPVGFYSGVSVQGNQLPPHPAKKVGSGPSIMTWAGFERTATGSRVFFQLSAEADYTLVQKDGVITVRMRRTKVNVRNNLRRLDLSYFKTPVQSVKVRRRGRDAVATISLKRAASPDVSFVDGGGSGYKLLVLSFTHASNAVAAPSRTSPKASGPKATDPTATDPTATE
ncbi:MAG: hypothetical protein ACE37F_12855 [Nannocystaceae bacterium]|nr:hypothetical protein [bacterium]